MFCEPSKIKFTGYVEEEILGEGNDGMAMGMLNTFQGVGTIVGPVVISALLDATGNWVLSFYVMTFFMLAAASLTLLLKIR